MVLTLLRFGADVNSMGSQGSALGAAITGGHNATTQLLLDKGAAFGPVYSGFRDAFGLASSRGNIEALEVLVSTLLSRPVTDESVMYSTSALYACSKAGNTSLMSRLIETGADIATVDIDGQHRTALHCTVACGHLEATTMLLRRGADPNGKPGKYQSPLWCAVDANRLDIVEALLHHGADFKSAGPALSFVQSETLEALIHRHDFRQAGGILCDANVEYLRSREMYLRDICGAVNRT